MKENVKNVSNGMGVFGWLFIVLFILKVNPGGHLTSVVADWSWWVIWAPIWVPTVIVLGILLIIGVIYLIAKAFDR